MTPEHALVGSALNAWKQQIERAEKLFLPLGDEQLQARVAPGKNRLIYLFGHLVAVHDGMLPLLGIGPRLYAELDAPFLKEVDGAVADLPPADELRQQWADVHRHLHAAFEGYTAADWAARHTAVSEADFATNPLRNRLAVLLSRTSHIAYHLGQCALAPT